MTGDSPVDHSEIRRFLHRHYGVRATELALLGGGLDMAARTYRVAVHSGPDLVLRCKRGDPRPAAYLVPRHLHDAGATAVVAPMRTRTHQSFLRWHGLVWSLYPFVVGDDGWTHGMTEQHWHSLGSALRTVHDTAADQALRAVVASDGFDVARYDVLAEWDAVIRRSVSADGPAGAFARTWKRHDETIMAMRGQMRLLAQCLRNRPRDDVLCHADLHPGNVLIEEDCVHIIDWDDVLLAPRERDFIFVPHGPPAAGDPGPSGLRTPPTSLLTAFLHGYEGPSTEIDWLALTYYRCERVIQDVIAFAGDVFGPTARGVDAAAEAGHWLRKIFGTGGEAEAAMAAARHLPADVDVLHQR